MNRDPAFLFYPSDFLVGTMLMTNDEVGKYMRLLCIAHAKGGYLTKQDMFKICNEDDIDVINKFLTDGEDIYYNERLLSEITKRKKYSDSRSSNRKGKKEEKPKHMYDISKTYDAHMENENEDTNINDSLVVNSNTTEELLDMLESEFKRPITPTEIEKVLYWYEKVGSNYIVHALRETLINHASNVGYMEAILKDWTKKEITLEMLNHGVKSK